MLQLKMKSLLPNFISLTRLLSLMFYPAIHHFITLSIIKFQFIWQVHQENKGSQMHLMPRHPLIKINELLGEVTKIVLLQTISQKKETKP